MRDSSEIFSGIKGRHLRAARALLEWKQEELAERAGVVRRTIVWIETGRGRTKHETMAKIVSAFADAGVVFDLSDRGTVVIGDETQEPSESPFRRSGSPPATPSRSSA